MLKRFLFIIAPVSIAVLFLIGIVHLCALRFRAGDVYPPLSSLRGDPLGLKVLHDSLKELDGIEVLRNYRPLSRLQANGSHGPFTLIYSGAKLEESSRHWDDLRRLAIAGNRVAVIFAPAESAPTPTPTPSPKKEEENDSKAKDAAFQNKDVAVGNKAEVKRRKPRKAEPAETPDEPKLETTQEALEHFGVHLHFEKDWDQIVLTARGTGDAEPALSWHSVAWFETTNPHQNVLYTCAKKPVVIECPLGKGSFVLASDSFFVTNEALRNERAPRLLAMLIGSNKKIVFDEYHHGVTETSGVAMLIRKYRLESVFGVLALLACLFIWKSASPLLPRAPVGQTSQQDTIVGRDATQGFVNLLRRSIPRSQLIATCVDEWNKAFAHQRGRIEPPAPSGANPIQQFSEIAKLLSKNRYGKSR